MGDLAAEDGFDLIQNLRQPVHGDRQENEIVLFDDPFQVVRCVEAGVEPRDPVHATESPCQVLGQMSSVEMIPIDGFAHVHIMVVEDDLLVLAAELVGEGRSETSRSDDGHPICIEG